MERPIIDQTAAGLGVVLSCCAAALLIPYTRRLIVDFAERELRDFDAQEAGRVVKRGGRATFEAMLQDGRRSLSEIVGQLTELFQNRRPVGVRSQAASERGTWRPGAPHASEQSTF